MWLVGRMRWVSVAIAAGAAVLGATDVRVGDGDTQACVDDDAARLDMAADTLPGLGAVGRGERGHVMDPAVSDAAQSQQMGLGRLPRLLPRRCVGQAQVCDAHFAHVTGLHPQRCAIAGQGIAAQRHVDTGSP